MSKNWSEEIKQDLQKTQIKLNEISNLLNYDFKNIKFLKQALTRQSAITEKHQNAYIKSYQRLEFLGDGVLNFIISDLVYEVFPESEEEDLSSLRSYVVRNEALGTYADKINLGRFLIIGKGEEFSNIRHHKKVLADLVESLFGAVFMDSNKNYDITKYVVLNFLKPIIYGDKHFKKCCENLDVYFNNLKTFEREVLPEISDVIDLNNQSCVLSDSSFSEFLNTNKTTFENSNFNNKNNEKKDSENKSFSNNNKSDATYIFNINNALNRRFCVVDIEYLLSLSEKGDELCTALDKTSQELHLNALIDFELLYVNSDENFQSVLTKNIQATEILIKAICSKITYYFNNLEIKRHYLFSKLLLYIIINLSSELNDFLFRSVFCLLHNGICEYYRKNYLASKQYLEKVFESLKIIEEDCNNTNNENTHIILNYKFTCLNYYAEIAFIHKDLTSLNDSVKIIASLNQTIDDCWKIVQFQKIYVKNYILNNYTQVNLVNEVIQKFFNQMAELSDEIKCSKAFLEDHIDLAILKHKLNESIDHSEIIEYQKLIEETCGENSVLLINIFSFYLDRSKEEYEREKFKYNFEKVEKIAFYSYKLMKIISYNFTINSKIYLEHLKENNNLLEEYTYFNSQ